MKKLLFIIVFLGVQFCLNARVVTGKVKCGTKGVPEVIVTDGYNFTTTDTKGNFNLEISPEASFVSIVPPSGYMAPKEDGFSKFYVKITPSLKQCVFSVKRVISGDYSLLAVADPQCKTEEHFNRLCGTPLSDLGRQISRLQQQGHTECNLLGDIGWDSWPAGIPAMYKNKLEEFKIPFHAVIGNHDFHLKKKGVANREDFEATFGPVNYAFHIGNDLVIGLKSIIYDTNRKYREGYGREELEFVRHLIELEKPDTKIYICQHAPIYRWFKDRDDKYCENGTEMLTLLRGRNVTFLSGHTHIRNVSRIAPGIEEHNVAALSACLWRMDKWNKDGTPRGFEILSRRGDKLDWRYHCTDYPDSMRCEFFGPGESLFHPNSFVVNAWDADKTWKMEWYQDGKYMGLMQQTTDCSPSFLREFAAFNKGYKPGDKMPEARRTHRNTHYYIATPSQYAGKIDIVVTDNNGTVTRRSFDMKSYVDMTAHRGSAGLMPENTFESMKNALDLGVNTLEMDVWLCGDGRPVVTHDSFFSYRYATRPDSSFIGETDPREYIYTMPYEKVRSYDTGKKSDPIFPQKQLLPAHKPLLEELIDFTERYARENGLDLPRYNIEIKFNHSEGEGVLWSRIEDNIDTTLPLLLSKGLGDRLIIQCFDPYGLEYMHKHYPDVALAYLVSKKKGKAFEKAMSYLSFIPQWFSPDHACVDEGLVKKCHDLGMKIVPWTIDDPKRFLELRQMGCDALMSNYMDMMLIAVRGYDYIPVQQ